ncbi:hypothetical protein OH77DRAFT_1412455 [Trametes cingulata]|nr:hypothetical protein OH77DRAFT_1412455 [Trametes cingulata]
MESDTWALLQALMSLRKTTPPEYPHPRELLASNPYTPPATLAQSIMHCSPLLSELVVVREWLHDSAPSPALFDPGATNGYWRFTRNAVVQGKRTGRMGAGLVDELDPDAVNRDKKERGLAPDDAAYDRTLLHALYAHVRAGQLDEAVELCRKANQPWRAASIRGALLFRWRAIANEPREADAMDDEDAEDEQRWRGNVRRRLWKKICCEAAVSNALPATERALYAALAPTTNTAGALKAVARTWEDHLWALVSLACEERLSAGLAEIERECFWEGGLGALEAPGAFAESAREGAGEGEEEWEREVVQGLEALGSVQVAEGAPADNPYHVSQLHIILDRTDALLEAFASGLQEGTYVSSPEYTTMTRFFAHLCLFLQMIDMPVSPYATQVILEAYLQVLEAAGQRELIAMYAGALGDNAVERYALFLTSLELSADVNERRLALTRAREHGLDIERVAVVTAERTIEKAFTILLPTKGPLPYITAMEPPPSEAEWLLVRSIEWTTFLESTYDTALEQANVILRYFLGHGRVQVAKTVLEMLPPELGTLREPEEEATEYMHYRQFFGVWEALARVAECEALEQPQMNKETRAAWLSDYKTLIEQAREQVVKLLTTDWLVSDPATRTSTGIKRPRDLVRIRQIYIPELILRLHTTLVNSRSRIPENLKHALSLVNIVADSRYRLYDAFTHQVGRRLGDYLGAVRQAVLAGLEGGGSDPFRILTV